MSLDTVIARPRSSSTHDLNCMGSIVFPEGETLSSPFGEFLFLPEDIPISPMETVEETRRNRLRMLVKKFGSMASLCEKLGYARNETAGLTRILNANVRHDREGKPYNMGSPMAREIETKLSLPTGWMDTPPTYAEIFGEDHAINKTLRAMERLPTYLQESAASLILGLTKTHENHLEQANAGVTITSAARTLHATESERVNDRTAKQVDAYATGKSVEEFTKKPKYEVQYWDHEKKAFVFASELSTPLHGNATAIISKTPKLVKTPTRVALIKGAVVKNNRTEMEKARKENSRIQKEALLGMATNASKSVKAGGYKSKKS